MQRLGIESLSPEAIVDGSIMDSALVVDAIQKLNRETGTKTASYATSLSGHSVIIKKIELPADGRPRSSTESIAVGSRAAHSPSTSTTFGSTTSTSDADAEEIEVGAENMEVLLVAVKREKVNDYVLP